MSLAFAFGLMIGAAVIVFGRDTPTGRRLAVQVHLRIALLRRWLARRG